jgi:O-antigen ligase
VESQEVARVLSSPLADRRPSRSFIPVQLDGYRLALFLLIVINVSRVHQSIAIVGQLRPALILVVLAGAYAVLNARKISLRGLFKTTEAKLILALFALACLSAVAGISMGNSGKYILENYSKVVIAAFLLLAGIRHVRDLFAFVVAYVVGSGILAFLAIFVFELTKSSGSEVARLAELYTFDANDIGVVLLVGLPLALLVAQHSRGLRKWFAIAVIVSLGITFARSGSRGTLIGLVALGGVLLVSLKTIPVWKRAAFVGAVTVALVVAAPPGYWVQMKTIFGLQEDYNWTSEDGRRQLIFRGLTYMSHYPLTGLGIYNFARAECMSDLSDKVRTAVRGHGIRCSAPHNTYLQVGAEIGVVGLALWCVLVFGGIRRLKRLRRRLPRAWRTGDAEQRFMYDATLYLSTSIVGFAVTSLFVSFAWLDIIYIVAVFQAGLTIAIRNRLARDLAQQPPPLPQPLGARPAQQGVLLPTM